MTKSTVPLPRYSIWQGIATALALGNRCYEELQALAKRPGIPGKDGVGFDDCQDTLEDGGRILIKRYFRDGEMIKETKLKTAMPVYRGVYQSEKVYDAGDMVTFGGGQFTAMREVAVGAQPEKTDAWVLSTKRGRDGKDGVMKAGPSGGPVKIGPGRA